MVKNTIRKRTLEDTSADVCLLFLYCMGGGLVQVLGIGEAEQLSYGLLFLEDLGAG